MRGGSDERRRRSSSSAAAPTGSARASSSTTAAATPPSRCARKATRRSWSTATRKRCRPTTTPSIRLYFEPLTFEDVLDIVDDESRPGTCVIVQFGGQTPLKLALALQAPACRSSARRPTRSTWPRTASGSPRCCSTWTSRSRRAARRRARARSARVAAKIGYPVLVRPSYVLGGRAMAIVYDEDALDRYMTHAVRCVARAPDPDRPVPRGRLRGRRRRRVRRPGPSSSAASWSTSRRPASTPATARASCRRTSDRRAAPETIRDYTRRIARALKVVGLMNVQYADQGRRGLRARGEPARVAHRAVRVEGDRRAARQDRRARDGRRDARRARPDGTSRSPACS